MRIFLILFSAATIITFAGAHPKPNITKPVANLEKRPRTPIWHRPPEERRKLSIFPKNNLKFVVTPKLETNDEPKVSTKRPSLRKFIMQDKNERGTWSFAPRERLMKTQRFTVTLAPPKHRNNDEMESEESKTVPVVLSNVNAKPEPNKHHKINKGNLIESVKLKKEHATSKNSHRAEQNFTEADVPHQTKVTDVRDFQKNQKDNNRTLATFGEHLIDVRSFEDDGLILDANETISKDQSESKSINNTSDIPTTKSAEDIVEGRELDLNDIKYPVHHDHNSLNMEEFNNHKTGQIMNLNDLEIMLEKIVNTTEQSNSSSTSDAIDDGMYIISNNDTSIDEIPPFDVTKPSDFYDVITVTIDDKENTNIHEIPDKTNEKLHPASETNVLNDKDITQLATDTLIVGNLESLINFTENATLSAANSEINPEQKENVGLNIDDTLKHFSTTPVDSDDITSTFANELIDERTTHAPTEDSKNSSDASNTLNLSLEIYESNMPLSIEEISNDCTENNCKESTLGKLNLTIEESSNEEIDKFTFDGNSNITSDASNDTAEERSKELFINKSESLTYEHISNEPSFNTDKALYNEFNADKSSNLSEQIKNESLIDSSANLTGEQFSNESALNMAVEDLSNESYADKSNNSEEIPSDSTIENSNSFSGEQISNESNITGQETSNESYLIDELSNESIEISDDGTEEQSSNESNTASEEDAYLTGDVSNESVEASYNLTDVEELSENAENVPDEKIPEELEASAPIQSTEDIAEEALINRFKRSNNIIEEESLATTISGFRYTGLEVRLNHDLSYKNINA